MNAHLSALLVAADIDRYISVSRCGYNGMYSVLQYHSVMQLVFYCQYIWDI